MSLIIPMTWKLSSHFAFREDYKTSSCIKSDKFGRFFFICVASLSQVFELPIHQISLSEVKGQL